MPKIAMSACLAGVNCRYNGKNKKNTELLEKHKEDEIILFCPEDAVLGTPRETIDIVEGRAIGNETQQDYTEAIEEQAQKFIAQYPNIDTIYCKSKSPSCALCSAKIFDKNKNLLQSTGTGIFIQELQKHYKNAKFIEKDGDA
ncbi:DUF523 domain-containing protein [Nitratiruptor tergarcus]|uniref:Uncharacterized conserved protein YbbK, DUF523 family n=1 Tax=Nitratiruptor tergarcus DSM 16512 TaxID=1069081 RepID=A0A1W1WPX4_9BACT|nr:DUF523 domain-containing protein [Nitratiruptor tergarcus]SMC08347.1 Uncharacterized conserved protein YbbK, DUF523 family [Nitratiruptor tergarcus DSM 16512]